MKRTLIVGVGVLLALTATTAIVHAQENDVINAKVPFSFTINDKVLPAGTYEFVATDPEDPSVLEARTANGEAVEAFATDSTESETPAAQTELVFDEVGGRHFLRQLWVEGTLIGHEIPISKAEHELEKNGAAKQQHHVPASHSSHRSMMQMH